MELIRRILSDAPEARTFRDDKPTLLVSWWCTCYAITIILFRVGGRYVRTEKVFREDVVMLLAMIPLVTRMAFVHVVLLYGTNNAVTTGLTPESISQREIGSRMVLVSRIMYTAYLWAIKYSVSIFLRTLTESVWQRSHQRALRYLHIFLAVTFLAAVIADLAACQPFSHYWQVVPDPGPQCRQGYAQLITMGTLNVFTNLTLVVFPLPMIMKSKVSKPRKLSIIFRMSLPLASVAFTLYQVPTVISRQGDQQFRSLAASVDMLMVTATANAVVLGSLLQDRGYKKSKYRHGADNSIFAKIPSNNRKLNSRWGSDEDLMRTSDSDGTKTQPDVELSLMEAGPPIPAKAHLQEIRVNSTWEIKVDQKM